MRKLMWFTVGFGTACGLCAYLLRAHYVLLAFGCLFIAAFALLLGRRWKQLMIAGMILFGCGVGFGWFEFYDGAYLASIRELDGQITQVTIEVSDYSYATNYGIGADGFLLDEGGRWKVRFYWNDPEMLLKPGDTVKGAFRLRYTVEAGTYHSGNGIFLLAYPAGAGEIIPCDEAPLRYWPVLLRQTILERIDAIFPQDTASFARALLLGDSYGISYKMDTALKNSGIRHVVAVSGLHVSILCMLLLYLTGKRRILSAMVGIPVLLLFAAVAGFTPSITRASVMMVLMLLSLLLKKEYDQLTALSFAALIMLLINPRVITSIGFQLSVASVAGIFLFSGGVLTWLQKRMGNVKGKNIKAVLLRWFSGSISVTLGAMCLTAPLTAYYFRSVSLAGILTNLLTLWVVTAIFCGILLSCMVSALWLPLGVGTAWVISWPIRYVLAVAAFLSKLPVAAVYTQSGSIRLWLAGCYMLLGIFLLRKQKRPMILVGIAAVGLCAALAWAWITPLFDEIRVTVLDVGQGQCVLLQSQGKTFMVDCGGDDPETAADLAAETLLSQGISHLDALVLTHYDYDHVGGIPYFLERIRADTVFLPGEDENGLAAGENTIRVEANLMLSFGTTNITLFPAYNAVSDNESSMCVLFQTEKYDILITGDRTVAGERLLLAQTDLPELELLVVGHHGSRTSTGEALLEATKPETAIISVGADNSYGHPAQEVLDRLEEYGCTVYRTDLDGTVIYRG